MFDVLQYSDLFSSPSHWNEMHFSACLVWKTRWAGVPSTFYVLFPPRPSSTKRFWYIHSITFTHVMSFNRTFIPNFLAAFSQHFIIWNLQIQVRWLHRSGHWSKFSYHIFWSFFNLFIVLFIILLHIEMFKISWFQLVALVFIHSLDSFNL